MAYTQAEIQAVLDQLNAGTVSTAQLEEQYGMPAEEIQANWDYLNQQNNYTAPVYDTDLLDIFQNTTANNTTTSPNYNGSFDDINNTLLNMSVQGNSSYEEGGIDFTGLDTGFMTPDAMTAEDTEGKYVTATTKETILGDSFDAIANSPLTAEEMTAQTAELLRKTGMSTDALAQVSDFTKDELDAQMALLGYDTRGNQVGWDAPTETPPAEPDGNIINQVGSKVGDVIDSIFQTLGLPNPSKIIGAPNTPSGTVVWGDTSGSPVINTGTTGAGTQTGVTTGNAALDAVLNKVTGILTGRIEAGDTINAATAKDILIATAAQETGISPEAIGKLIEAGGDITKLTNLNEQDATKIGIDLSNQDGEVRDDGGVVRDDGSIVYPDGRVVRADGTVVNPFDSEEPQPTTPPKTIIDPFTDAYPSPPDEEPTPVVTPTTPPPPPAEGGGGGGGGGGGSGFGITEGMFGDFIVNQRVAPKTKLLTRLFRNV